jgi:hypothetical protein
MGIFSNFIDRRSLNQPPAQVAENPAEPVVEEKEGFAIVDKRSAATTEPQLPNAPEAVVAESYAPISDGVVHEPPAEMVQPEPATAVETPDVAKRAGTIEQAKERGVNTLGSLKQRLSGWFSQNMPTFTRAIDKVGNAVRVTPAVLVGLSGMAKDISAQRWDEVKTTAGEKYIGMLQTKDEIIDKAETKVRSAVEAGSNKIITLAQNGTEKVLLGANTVKSKYVNSERARVAAMLSDLEDYAASVAKRYADKREEVSKSYEERRARLEEEYKQKLAAINQSEEKAIERTKVNETRSLAEIGDDIATNQRFLRDMDAILERLQNRRNALLARKAAQASGPDSFNIAA